MRSGLSAPNVMDGMPGLTQPPISTGETFVYEFTLQDAGSVGISSSRCVVSWWFECCAFMPTVDGSKMRNSELVPWFGLMLSAVAAHSSCRACRSEHFASFLTFSRLRRRFMRRTS